MTEEEIRQTMTELRCKGMLAEYDDQLRSPDMRSLSFNDRLGLLLSSERDLKRSNKVRNCHNLARFAQPNAYTEDIIYDEDRKLDRDTVIKLASCSFVKNKENVLVLGKSDSGKTFTGCALGNAACRRGIKTKYVRLADFFSEIERAESEGKYRKVFSDYCRVPLLIADDFLLSIPSVKQVQILLELVEHREFTASTVICSQLHPSNWQQRIDEKIQANSIYSRLVPQAHWLEINGTQPMRERIRCRR